MPRKRKEPIRESAIQRRIAFARAYCRIGIAAEAYREVFPKSRLWKPDSVASEASALLSDPTVREEIARVNNAAFKDAIPRRLEIAKTLTDIMRGNLKERRTFKVRTPAGEKMDTIDIPAPISQRIRAARELAAMLPSVSPEKKDDEKHDESEDTLKETLEEIRRKRGEKK
jgi:phage terminase small subunit